mgnify:CR=1 FL=1
MSKKQILKISSDGKTVSGLYADCLQGLGDLHVSRASHVEFNEQLGKWVVEPLIGPNKNSCLLETFDKRGDAIAAEIKMLSEQHKSCLL